MVLYSRTYQPRDPGGGVGDEEENVPDLGLGLSGAQANEASNDNKAGDHESESDGPWADCQGNPIDATS